MPNDPNPASIEAPPTTRPLTRIAREPAAAEKKVPGRLPPAPQRKLMGSKVFLPHITLHASQVYPDAVEASENERTRGGGQYSFIRLRLFNTIKKQFKIILVENSAAIRWPIADHERLANPEGLEIADTAWKIKYGDALEQPKKYADDAFGEDYLELCYGVIQVLFDDKQTMDHVWESVMEERAPHFDPLSQNDHNDGRVNRGPRIDDLRTKYSQSTR
jgi:hypothetical protein